MAETRLRASTPWLRIIFLFAAGASAASLIGKVPVSLPELQGDIGLSLSEAGLVISIFSLIAALFGAGFGAVADRYGPERIAIAGLLFAAIASLVGSIGKSAEFLFLTRVMEGVGFFLASTSIPAIMLKLSNPEDRQKAMGLWGAFLPAGTALMVIGGGAMVATIGWRGLWLFTAILLFAAAIVVRYASDASLKVSQPITRFSFFEIYKILGKPGPLLMALVFVAYSAQFLAVTAFVPLILVDEKGWSLAAAGLAGGFIIGANVLGNIASGVLLDLGAKRRNILVFGAAGMAVGASILLSAPIPVTWKLVGGTVFTVTGGLIPGALFAGTSIHAPNGTEVSTLNGLLLQGAAVGQLAGPPVAVAFAQSAASWSGVLWFTVPTACIAIVLAFLLGRLESRLSSDVGDL